ncbi:MAG: peptidylprolyl isomerase [Gammaproteobacteria bacterium]|nr:peptidylprolyl isomerase [Gammaproteobacteria bacterium]
MHHRLYIPALAAALLLSACVKKDVEPLTPQQKAETFEAFITAATRKTEAELTPEELRQVFDQYLTMQIAADAGEKAGLDRKHDVAAQLRVLHMNVLSEAAMRKYLDEHPVVDADLSAEYDAQVAAVPLEYSARHILVDDKATAEAIIVKLDGGADFAKLAREKSKDPSAANGGDLGWFAPQTMVQPFADAVAALEKGKYTTVPVETQFGWHVILLEDTRKPTLPTLAEVKDRLQEMVQRKKIQTHLDELKAQSGIDADEAYEEMKAALAAEAKKKIKLEAPEFGEPRKPVQEEGATAPDTATSGG